RRVGLAPLARMEISAQAADRLGSSPLPPTSKLQIRTEQRYRLSLASPGLATLFFRLLFVNLGHILGGLLSNSFRSAGWHLSALLGLASDVTNTYPLRRDKDRKSIVYGMSDVHISHTT